MRFTRVHPTSPVELSRAILDDLEALSAGLRAIASAIPAPAASPIDLIAADGRGRAALVTFCLEADHDTIGRAVEQWSWAVSNLGALRSLVPVAGLDLSMEPRVLVVAARALQAARRLAACISRPEVELYEAALIAAGDRRGLLIERAEAVPVPPAGGAAGIDPILASIPAGASRSLTRRILEELRDASGEAGEPRPVGVEGGIELILGSRVVAGLMVTQAGLHLARFEEAAEVLPIADDEGCRRAVGLLLAAAGAAQGRAAARPAAARGAAVALSPEEIAEFEVIARPAEGRPERRREQEPPPQAPQAAHELSPIRGTRPRFLEN